MLAFSVSVTLNRVINYNYKALIGLATDIHKVAALNIDTLNGIQRSIEPVHLSC